MESHHDIKINTPKCFDKFLQRVFIPVPLLLAACGAPGYDATNTTANSILIFGAVDQVNVSLSTQSCGAALAQIKTLFDSANTNNQIRLATAASYGCSARVNTFQILSDLTKASDLGGSGLWKFLAKEFPSVASPDDKLPTSAGLGTDAAQAAVVAGTVFVAADTINSTTNNPGSLIFTDRISDANSYITFLSMSLMGSLLYRDGQPDTTNYVKSVALPWLTAATVAGNGCAFASGLLNFFDGLESITKAAPTVLKPSYQAMTTFLAGGLDAACSTGCTTCGLSCAKCPTSLRNRDSCTGLNTDKNSCAAAGIATFVNGSWI